MMIKILLNNSVTYAKKIVAIKATKSPNVELNILSNPSKQLKRNKLYKLFSTIYQSTLKGGLNPKFIPKKPIVQLQIDFKKLKSPKQESVTKFRKAFLRLLGTTIKKSHKETISEKEFKQLETLLNAFYDTHKNQKSEIFIKHFELAFELANKLFVNLKIPFIIKQHISLGYDTNGDNAKTVKSLTPLYKKMLQNSLNPNHDPTDSAGVWSLYSLKTLDFGKIQIGNIRYKITRILTGGGGQAIIYQCQNTASKKIGLILKVLKAPFQGGDDNRIFEMYANLKLKKEAHIVAAHEIFKSSNGKLKILAMAPYPMGDLYTYLMTKKHLDRKEYISVMFDSVSALKESILRGVLYRDLKLKNILLKRDPKTKQLHAYLVDFGIVYIFPDMNFPAGIGFTKKKCGQRWFSFS